MLALMNKSVIKFAFVQILLRVNLISKKLRIFCFSQNLISNCLKKLWTLRKLEILLMTLLTRLISTETFDLLLNKWSVKLKLFTRKTFNYSLNTLSQRQLKRYSCYCCFGLGRLYYLFLLVSLPRYCFSLAGKQTIYFF